MFITKQGIRITRTDHFQRNIAMRKCDATLFVSNGDTCTCSGIGNMVWIILNVIGIDRHEILHNDHVECLRPLETAVFFHPLFRCNNFACSAFCKRIHFQFERCLYQWLAFSSWLQKLILVRMICIVGHSRMRGQVLLNPNFVETSSGRRRPFQ